MEYNLESIKFDFWNSTQDKERAIRSELQPTADEVFGKIYDEILNNVGFYVTAYHTDEEKVANMRAFVLYFVAEQMQKAEAYLPNKVSGRRSKNPKLTVTAEPVVRRVFEESITRAFDKHLPSSSNEQLWQMFSAYHFLDNITQSSVDKVVQFKQKSVEKSRSTKKSKSNSEIYFRQIELEANESDKPYQN